MNKKGFTLIELLAIIVIIALIAVLASPSIIGLFNTSKEKLYDIMIEDIKTAGENYYLECENGGELSKISSYCKVSNNQVENNEIKNITLGEMVKTGFLKANGNKSDGVNKVINPKTGKDIGDCTVRITKSKGNNTTINTTIVNQACIDGE